MYNESSNCSVHTSICVLLSFATQHTVGNASVYNGDLCKKQGPPPNMIHPVQACLITESQEDGQRICTKQMTTVSIRIHTIALL